MISVNELKQIQLHRGHLTDKSDKHTVCRDLNGIQAQFMSNVPHALGIRCNEKTQKDGFGEGLLKNWTVRGTVHVFNQDDLPLFKYHRDDNPYRNYSCNPRDCRIAPDRLEFLSRFIVERVESGVGVREDLKQECYSAGMTETEGGFVFDQWGGLLRTLCERGFLCYKVQEKKEFIPCPEFIPMEKDAAILEQAQRYFANFAPATIKDAAYYFHWTQSYTKQIMSTLPLEVITVAGKDYYYIGKLKSDYPDIPRCILLAGFDQLMLGYQKSESIYLPPENLRGIFNLAGIVMPAILLDGRVVGRWGRKNKKITVTLFESVAQRGKNHILREISESFDEINKIEWI